MFDFLMWAGGIIISTAFGALGWLITMVFARLDKHAENTEKRFTENENKHEVLSGRFEEHRVYSVQNFASRVDLNSIFERVLNKLDKIDEKLDKKADKA